MTCMVYLGGWRHREGTDLEAYAQGMLQTPSVSNPNGEYKALGLNMAYERPNDGNQWYNTNPNDLTSREDIDRYMKGYNDTLMLLDYLEGEAVLNKGSQDWTMLGSRRLISNTEGLTPRINLIRCVLWVMRKKPSPYIQ